MPSNWSDLDRPPLSARSLATALVRPGSLWTEVRVVEETASTNADVRVAALAGAAEGLVVVAESQWGGRGRLGRTWISPPRAGLTFSVLLRPAGVPPVRWGWLPLLVGVSLTRAVRRLGAVPAGLKWPNDLLAGDDRGKCAGLLAEVVSSGDRPAVVVGIGLNVSTTAGELPTEHATSLTVVGSACVDRDPLLRAVLRELATDYAGWRDHAGDAEASGLLAAYRESCDTLGRQVTVSLPVGDELRGTAVAVDAEGRLVVRGPGGVEHHLSAGDVVHVRPR